MKKNNVVYLFGEPPKRERPVPVKRMMKKIVDDNPIGMFAMTWDRNGCVNFYNTHDKKRDFIRSALMDSLIHH